MTSAVAETLTQRYAKIFAEDKAKMALPIPCPLSSAYCALDLEHSRALTLREQKLVDPKAQVEKPKTALPKPEYLFDKFSAALQDKVPK